MKKNLLLVLVCFPLLATACPTVTTVPSIGVPCSNNLDASAFGFTLVIPADFVCTTVEENPRLLVSTRYRQESTGYIAAVNLAPLETDCNSNGIPDATDIAADASLDTNTNGILDTCDGCGGDPVCQELNSITTGNGITFRVFRITSPNFIQYQGSTVLSGGNVLAISVTTLSTTDNPALQTILSTILETVETN